MPKTPIFALPVKAITAPCGPDWIHEVKHDGYRLMVVRDYESARLLTKSGLDYTKRFPWIVEAALKIRKPQFILDGEAVLLGADGRSDFDGLHSGRNNAAVQFYGFDILSLDGEDLRKAPLLERKKHLAVLLARRSAGIHVAPFERGAIGQDLFRAACAMGLEGIVSKHLDRAYSTGRCSHWLKIKNRHHPAFMRVQNQF